MYMIYVYIHIILFIYRKWDRLPINWCRIFDNDSSCDNSLVALIESLSPHAVQQIKKNFIKIKNYHKNDSTEKKTVGLVASILNHRTLARIQHLPEASATWLDRSVVLYIVPGCYGIFISYPQK